MYLMKYNDMNQEKLRSGANIQTDIDHDQHESIKAKNITNKY